MEIFGIGLHILIAIFFAVHAIRRGQELYWVMLLFFFPLLGSLVYFFAIYLPELRQSRGAYVAGKAVREVVDPRRGLRHAREAFERTPTVDNRLRFADALLESGAAVEALQHYREAAQGPFADDPALLLGLAHAEIDNGHFAECKATLDRLFVARPEARQQPLPALLQARVLAETGDPAARDAFEAALVVAVGPEPRCRFAEWLVMQGNPADRQRARALYEEIISDAKHWHSHARSLNREWLQRAKEGLSAA
jgi:hypothetical protein